MHNIDLKHVLQKTESNQLNKYHKPWRSTLINQVTSSLRFYIDFHLAQPIKPDVLVII